MKNKWDSVWNLVWMVVAVHADYQYEPNYADSKYAAFNPLLIPPSGGQQSLPVDPAIFQRCWLESQIPMAVALGDLSHWSTMCSRNYFSTCRSSLPVALLSYGLSPYQRDYVMSVLDAWVDGGAPYLCNIGLSSITSLMENGGSKCLHQTAGVRVEKCNRQLATLGTGIEYSDQYCYDWDADFQCYIDAVNTCPDDSLNSFLWDFFENVMWASPCKDISRFTNDARSLNSLNSALILLLPVLITFLASRNT